MEEITKEETPPTSNVPTVGQGCALIAGGAALGFFGCLGAVAADSAPLIFLSLSLGGIVILWGFVRLVMVTWRSMSRRIDE